MPIECRGRFREEWLRRTGARCESPGRSLATGCRTESESHERGPTGIAGVRPALWKRVSIRIGECAVRQASSGVLSVCPIRERT